MGCVENHDRLIDDRIELEQVLTSKNGLDLRIRISPTLVDPKCPVEFYDKKCLAVGTNDSKWSSGSEQWDSVRIDVKGCTGKPNNEACHRCPLRARLSE